MEQQSQWTSERSKRADNGNRSFLSALCLLTLVGGALRFAGLDDRDFWFDESCTFIYVHHLFDWPEDSSLLAESTNLPYYVALRGWVSLFGDSEPAYRSMSALMATLAIPVLGLLARRIGGPLAGVICAAVAAFHPLHIHYAHEARAYAMWVLLLSLALFLLHEAGRRGRWRWWAAYGLVSVVCLHLHYFTVYWLPATVVVVVVAEDRSRAVRQWLVTTVAVGVGFVPYFLLAAWPAARGGGSAWIAEHWQPITAIPRTLWALMPAGGYPAHLRGLSLLSADTVRFEQPWLVAANGIARALPAALVAAVFLFLLARRIRLGREGNARQAGQRPYHLLLGTLTLLPLILAWTYSVVVRPNYLVGRYDLLAWPAFVVWLALAIAELSQALTRRAAYRAAAAICLPMLACSLVPIGRMASLNPGPTFHNIRAQRLAQLAGPGDLAIAFSYDRDYLQYYLHRANFAGRIVSYPSWLDRQVGWVDTEADLALGSSALLEKDAAACVGLVDSVVAQNGHIWLLVDSLEARGSKARAEINERLLIAVARAGYETRLVDDALLILELAPPLSNLGKGG